MAELYWKYSSRKYYCYSRLGYIWYPISVANIKSTFINIVGYIAKTYSDPDSESTECISFELLDKLNRSGLSTPTLTTLLFVQISIQIQLLITKPQTHCRTYLMRLLSFIDSLIAKKSNTCMAKANTLLKSFVTANSDKEQSIKCLRRKRKLSVSKQKKFVSTEILIVNFFISYTTLKLVLHTNRKSKIHFVFYNKVFFYGSLNH